MVPTWLFQRLTALAASGAALNPACDMLCLRVQHRRSVARLGGSNGQLACCALGANTLLFVPGIRL
jgi:hypothetical protein